MNETSTDDTHAPASTRRGFLKLAGAAGLAATWGLDAVAGAADGGGAGAPATGAAASTAAEPKPSSHGYQPKGSVPGRKIVLNGASYHVGEQGSGDKAVVLLHGMPDTSGVWGAQVAALAGAGYRVIAPDLLGYGESDKPADVARYRGELLVADAIALLDTLELSRVDLVGHDWGGFLSWELALALPDRIRRHVVVSTGHPDVFYRSLSSPDTVRRNWYMYLNTQDAAADLYAANDGTFFKTVMIPTHPAKDEVWSRVKEPSAMRGMLNWDKGNPVAASYLAAVSGQVPRRPCRVPTLGLWGSGDTYLWESQMIESADSMAAPWQYRRIENASHWVMLDQPAQVNDAMLGWFAAG